MFGNRGNPTHTKNSIFMGKKNIFLTLPRTEMSIVLTMRRRYQLMNEIITVVGGVRDV